MRNGCPCTSKAYGSASGQRARDPQHRHDDHRRQKQLDPRPPRQRPSCQDHDAQRETHTQPVHRCPLRAEQPWCDQPRLLEPERVHPTQDSRAHGRNCQHDRARRQSRQHPPPQWPRCLQQDPDPDHEQSHEAHQRVHRHGTQQQPRSHDRTTRQQPLQAEQHQCVRQQPRRRERLAYVEDLLATHRNLLDRQPHQREHHDYAVRDHRLKQPDQPEIKQRVTNQVDQPEQQGPANQPRRRRYQSGKQ